MDEDTGVIDTEPFWPYGKLFKSFGAADTDEDTADAATKL